MTETVQPYLSVDGDSNLDMESPAYQAFLAWLRSEGIKPEDAKRCEVYDGKPPYAVMTMYETDAKGVKVWDEISEECVTYTDITRLSSLPPSREV